MTEPRVITLERLPSLGVLFTQAAAKSLAPRTGGVRDGAAGGDSTTSGALEDVEVRCPRVRIERTRLAAYDRVCGFGLRDAVPATYLHVLVFPLQVALMADRSFPLSLVGLIHVRNRIVAHRPVDAAEPLSLRATAVALRPYPKSGQGSHPKSSRPRGALVDLVGQVRVAEELVWEGVSTYLDRGASVAAVPGGLAPESPVAVHLPDERTRGVWQVAAHLGRRYASVSGDVNPMHLSPMAARAFGFPRALAHGMWTKAHALAALDPVLPAAYAVDVAFSKPLLLPSVARFLLAQEGQGWDFAVRPARGTGDHLRGTVRQV